eukprot:746539-Amphidinium_carterae.1
MQRQHVSTGLAVALQERENEEWPVKSPVRSRSLAREDRAMLAVLTGRGSSACDSNAACVDEH